MRSFIILFLFMHFSVFYAQETSSNKVESKANQDISSVISKSIYSIKLLSSEEKNQGNDITLEKSNDKIEGKIQKDLATVNIKSISISNDRAVAECEYFITNNDSIIKINKTVELSNETGSWEVIAQDSWDTWPPAKEDVRIIANQYSMVQTPHYAGINDVNMSVSVSRLDRKLFPECSSLSMDDYYYSADKQAGFVVTPDWNRIIYGNETQLAVSSYGDHPGDFKFNEPQALVADPYGYVYVADKGSNSVVKLQYNSSTDRLSFVKKLNIPTLKQPTDICYAKSYGTTLPERLYILDRRNNKILVTDLEGNLFLSFNSYIYNGITYDLGPIDYIACSRQDRILIMISKQRHLAYIVEENMTPTNPIKVLNILKFPGATLLGDPGMNALGEFIIPDERLNMLHFVLPYEGYICSAPSGALEYPTSAANNFANRSGYILHDFYIANRWSNTRGVVKFLREADLINTQYLGIKNGSLLFGYYLTGYSNVTVKLMDHLGNIITQISYTWSIKQKYYSIPYNNLTPGAYTLEIVYRPTNDQYYNAIYQQGYKSKTINFTVWNKLPTTVTASTTIGPGTYYAMDSLIVSNNSTLTIAAGTKILFNTNKFIIALSGSKIICNGTSAQPIRFERAYSQNPWNGVSLYGEGSQFTYCLFDGAINNVNIYSINNTFTNCTFRRATRGLSANRTPSSQRSGFKVNYCLFENNTYGIVANYSNGLIGRSDIRYNVLDGIYITNSTIGEGGSSGGAGFGMNYVHDNSRYGINIGIEGRLWLGYGQYYGKNRISNNREHEIYLNGNFAYLYQSPRTENGSTGGGYNDIYDETASNCLIYNLAKTYDGEAYVSITQIAENNFWNTCGSPSTWMYGAVDYTPYKEYSLASISSPSVPMNIEKPASSGVIQVLSASMAEKASTGIMDGEDAQVILDAKQRILTLRNIININPDDPKNASRMNEIFGLIGLIGKDKASEDIYSLHQYITERKNLYTLSSKTSLKKDNILGENAILLEVAEKVRNSEFKEALNLIDNAEARITNQDIKRDLLTQKIVALQQTNDFSKALSSLEDLKNIVKNSSNNKYYTEPTYDILEEELYTQLGIFNQALKQQFTKDVAELNEGQIPETFHLFQNYPNPFNPSTNIKFSIPEPSNVKIEIFDITGRLIEVLTNTNYDTGYHILEFNGKHLASGVYLLRANLTPIANKSARQSFTSKLVLLK